MTIYQVTLQELRLFLLVSRTLSFSEAGREAGLPQSSISAKIRQLEQKLGLTLIDRTTRNVSLSEVGKSFQPALERVLNDLDHQILALGQLRDLEIGHVHIACVPSVAMQLLPRVVARFKQDYPGVGVEITETTAAHTLELMMSGAADFAIANDPPPSAELRAEVLIRDVFGLVVRRDHPMAARNGIRWKEALTEGLVIMGGQTGIRHEMERHVPPAELRAASRYEAAHPSSVLAMVAQGVGVAVMPSLAWPAADDRNLTVRSLEPPRLVRTLFLIRRSRKAFSPAAKAFRQTILSGAIREMSGADFVLRDDERETDQP